MLHIGRGRRDSGGDVSGQTGWDKKTNMTGMGEGWLCPYIPLQRCYLYSGLCFGILPLRHAMGVRQREQDTCSETRHDDDVNFLGGDFLPKFSLSLLPTLPTHCSLLCVPGGRRTWFLWHLQHLPPYPPSVPSPLPSSPPCLPNHSFSLPYLPTPPPALLYFSCLPFVTQVSVVPVVCDRHGRRCIQPLCHENVGGVRAGILAWADSGQAVFMKAWLGMVNRKFILHTFLHTTHTT